MVYGTEVHHDIEVSGRPRSVIGEVEVSGTGNLVLRVGHEVASGWEQTEHVVLTVGEATALVLAIAERALPAHQHIAIAHAFGIPV